MSSPSEIDRKFIQEKVDSKPGQVRTEVLVDPSKHYDYSIIRITGEKVMGMASGNAFFMKNLPPDKSAYLTFHRAVGKLASSGIMPEYLGMNINFPSETTEEVASHFWNSLNIESKKFQAMITGRSIAARETVSEPFVGGVTAMGTSQNSFFMDPEMIKDGDRILVSKTAGIEAAALLAHLIPEKLEEKIGQYNAKMAGKLFFKTSTIQEAQEALKFGLGNNGVTGLKSADETGIIGALEEFCHAGNFGAEVVFDDIPLYDEVKEICALYDLDPYRINSMGAMIISVQENAAEDFIKELVGNGIDVVDVGKVDRKSNTLRISGGTPEPESATVFYDKLSSILQN